MPGRVWTRDKLIDKIRTLHAQGVDRGRRQRSKRRTASYFHRRARAAILEAGGRLWEAAGLPYG